MSAPLHANTSPDATTQDGTYPRPQLLRPLWCDLSGEWDFALVDEPGTAIGEVVFDRKIIVPFPPESPASGIHETGFLPTVWYRRSVGPTELREAGWAGAESRILLHFGAVDHTATVWLNGQLVATHDGGQSPFTADITGSVDLEGDNIIIVRAVDPPGDVSVLRGKQDWHEAPHAIWYHRTTGIWQPVWLECVPAVFVAGLQWRTDLPSATVELDVELQGDLDLESRVRITLSHEGVMLAEATVRTMGSAVCSARLVIPIQLNGQQYEELLWTPKRPTLIGATVALEDRHGAVVDTISSYLGLRSVLASREKLLVNDRPVMIRAVLAQNYWPDTHLAATPEALRREVELILALGFNTARIHQKAEDPRFLYWADRLGLMVWAETASAYAFDRRAMTSLVSEWSAIVHRDQSHPSIIAWVPLNESWGVQHISHDARQRAFSRSISDLTRALDGTRPVISNDGWEHTTSDIWTIHDYESDPEVIAARYGDRAKVREMLEGFGPAGRRMSVGEGGHDQPVMLTEFGGISLNTGSDADWGYSTDDDPDAFEEHVTAILRAAGDARALAGFCYTQLTDTGQETNGLLYADRTPKFPIDHLRAAVRGESSP